MIKRDRNMKKGIQKFFTYSWVEKKKKSTKNMNNIEMKEHKVSSVLAQSQGRRTRRPDRNSDNATDLLVLYLLDTTKVLRGVPLQYHPRLREDVHAEGRDRTIREAPP